MPRALFLLICIVAIAEPALAQSESPWLRAITELAAFFSGPFARGAALIATVVGFLVVSTGEGGAYRFVGPWLIGCGGALLAGNLLSWLFLI